MAASDLTALTPDNACKRVALEATATNAREIQLPNWARRVTLAFKQTDGTTDDSGALAFSGTDAAAIGNDVLPIASGAAYSFALTEGKQRPSSLSIYVTAGTASAFCHVHVSAYEGA